MMVELSMGLLVTLLVLATIGAGFIIGCIIAVVIMLIPGLKASIEAGKVETELIKAEKIKKIKEKFEVTSIEETLPEELIPEYVEEFSTESDIPVIDIPTEVSSEVVEEIKEVIVEETAVISLPEGSLKIGQEGSFTVYVYPTTGEWFAKGDESGTVYQAKSLAELNRLIENIQ